MTSRRAVTSPETVRNFRSIANIGRAAAEKDGGRLASLRWSPALLGISLLAERAESTPQPEHASEHFAAPSLRPIVRIPALSFAPAPRPAPLRSF